ncbi:hypothetical protein IAU60_000231 [Kwoniella sp. DSM 27419]
MEPARDREPLGSLSLNTPLSQRAGPSTPSSTSSTARKLAPIFLNKRRSPTTATVTSVPTSIDRNDASCSYTVAYPSSSSGSPVSRKRARLEASSSSTSMSSADHTTREATSGSTPTLMDLDANASEGLDDLTIGLGAKSHVRMHSIHDWFLPSTSQAYERVKLQHVHAASLPSMAGPGAGAGAGVTGPGVWRRGRKRLGVAACRSSLLDPSLQRLITTQDPYLSTLVTSTLPYHPLVPPSLLLLPSIHPPTGRPREFAPPLSLAFNSIAKNYDMPSARAAGLRRLIAVAGEEGGVRILDVDEGLGGHREEKGFWWRAHGNAIFDLKWSKDDTRVLTASGDQTTRLHALTTPTPTLLATLRGHTSSVKTTVFLDPTRCAGDPSDSSIIATGGRDGNILIYDIRCQGRRVTHGHDSLSPSPGPSGSSRRSSRERERYADGVPGFTAQSGRGMELDPVMTIKAAHGDGKRGAGRTATRSVTSLVALQSMPGVLASGGSFDGIVKLWDLRFPAPTTRSPEPRPACTSVGMLPDPTLHGNMPSRRARSINAMCESPTNGDLYVLSGDSKIHSLRPSYAMASAEDGSVSREAIGTKSFTDTNLLVSSFYVRLAISPDGRYLSSGSCRGGVMTWDTAAPGHQATRLGMGMGGVEWPEGKEREVCAVDWGRDMLAASSDDLATRIWRSNRDAARWLKQDPPAAGEQWAGAVC